MIQSGCFPFCRAPAPCQLRWFASPCICSVDATPAGAEETSASAVKTDAAPKSKRQAAE